MLRPQIQELCCLDVPDVRSWNPKRPEDLYLGVYIRIGVEGESGGDDFQLLVASPEAIAKRRHLYPAKYLERALTTEVFDWDTIVSYVQDKVSTCTSSTWEAIADKLTTYFIWEYEDFEQNSELEPDH